MQTLKPIMRLRSRIVLHLNVVFSVAYVLHSVCVTAWCRATPLIGSAIG